MRKHSKCLTIKEYLQKLSINLLNISTETTGSLPHEENSRSAILADLSLEINLVGTRENLRRNDFWEQFLDERQLLSFEADSDSDLDSESFMLELIIWMKAAIQTSNKISSNSINRILENSLQAVPGQISQLAANDEQGEFRPKKTEKMNNARLEPESEFDSGIREVNDSIYDNRINTRNLPVDKHRILYNDEEASQISNPISFDDDNNEELHGFEAPKKFKHSDNEYSSKRLKTLEKIICPENVQFTLTKLQVDNYCLEVLKKIINTLSYEKIPKTIYRQTNVHKAVRATKNFINVLCKEKNSSIKVIDFYINPIIVFIKKLFDFSYFKHFEMHNREAYMQLILEFCDCKCVCEKTITFLMEELEQLINLRNEYEKKNNYDQSHNIKEFFILHGLEIALKKYCLIEPTTSALPMTDLTNLGQRQFQVHFPRSEELREESFHLIWICKLTSLTNVETNNHLNNVDEWIQELINILSAKLN